MRLSYLLLAAAVALTACKKQEAPLEPAAAAAPAGQAPAAAPPPAAAADTIKGKILEKINASNYSYLRLQTASGEIWAAVPVTPAEVGAEVTVAQPMAMDGFESKTLGRKFDKLVFGTLAGDAPAGHGAVGAPEGNTATAPAAVPSMGAPAAGIGATPPPSAAEVGPIHVDKAPGAEGRTVAEVFANKATLKESHVAIHGKVVKFSGGIMGRNWLHLRDGTGTEAAGDHDITVTTADTAAVGETVTIHGVVRLDKDFGAGYAYAVIVEEAKIQK